MTELARPEPHPDLSIDQQVALRTAADNPGRRFRRLDAPARIGGHHRDGTSIARWPRLPDTGRSQPALEDVTRLAGNRAIAGTAGAEPQQQTNPAAIAAMAGPGIDITGEDPQTRTDENIGPAGVVITMSCGDSGRAFPGKRSENRALPGPARLGLVTVGVIRDDLGHRVHAAQPAHHREPAVPATRRRQLAICGNDAGPAAGENARTAALSLVIADTHPDVGICGLLRPLVPRPQRHRRRCTRPRPAPPSTTGGQSPDRRPTRRRFPNRRQRSHR